MKTLFFIEVTDTYGGAANYSWVTRHVIRASTMRGAVNKIGRLSGMTWRKDYGDAWNARYNSRSGLTCYFVRRYEAEYDSEFSYHTDER